MRASTNDLVLLAVGETLGWRDTASRILAASASRSPLVVASRCIAPADSPGTFSINSRMDLKRALVFA